MSPRGLTSRWQFAGKNFEKKHKNLDVSDRKERFRTGGGPQPADDPVAPTVGDFKLNKKTDKTNKIACAPTKDSDQPGHPRNLIRVFAVRMKKLGSLATRWAQQRL